MIPVRYTNVLYNTTGRSASSFAQPHGWEEQGDCCTQTRPLSKPISSNFTSSPCKLEFILPGRLLFFGITPSRAAQGKNPYPGKTIKMQNSKLFVILALQVTSTFCSVQLGKRLHGKDISFLKYAEPVAQYEHFSLGTRQNTDIGSWSLRAAICPDKTTECSVGDPAMLACCPSNLNCVSYAYAIACCPTCT